MKVTGLRNPCSQLDAIHLGLMQATLDRDATGCLLRKAGVMSVVVRGGVVAPGDEILIELLPEPHRELDRVQ